MPLPASGPITLSQIRDELAPGNPAGLALGYYVGRSYSIAGGGTRVIPADPSFSDFYALQRVAYRIDSETIFRQSAGTASLSFAPDGGFFKSSLTSDVRTLAYSWVTGAAAALYSLRVRNVVGTFTSSSGIDTWLPLTSNRNYGRGGGPLEQIVTALYEIREDASGVIVASGTITLQVAGSL